MWFFPVLGFALEENLRGKKKKRSKVVLRVFRTGKVEVLTWRFFALDSVVRLEFFTKNVCSHPGTDPTDKPARVNFPRVTFEPTII